MTPHRIPTRRALVLTAALAGAACSGSPGTEAARPTNLLLVVLDTTRADHLSCYGYGRETTPAVDGLAARGARFAEAWSQSSLTPVSAGSFLTGTLPSRHGVRSLWMVEEEALGADVESLATRLGRHGLATAAFVSARPMGAHYGLGQGFDVYDDRVPARPTSPCGNEYQRRADATTDRALAWLGAHGLDPFAVLVHYFDTHDATLAPPREFLAPRVSFPLPADVDAPCALVGLRDAPRVELYDAELAWMDAQVARLLELLDRLEVLDDTLVVVLADHGEGLGDHGNWTHGWLHREQLRVPLVLAGPGIPRGAVVDARVRLVDLLPTVLELFDAGAPARDVAGASLVPLLDGTPGEAREAYAEVHHAIEDRLRRDAAMYTLADGDWKYIHRPRTGLHELYRLADDPGELRNLYAADHPEAARLLARLETLGVLDDTTFSAERVEAEQRDALEDLGYLGTDPVDPVDEDDEDDEDDD